MPQQEEKKPKETPKGTPKAKSDGNPEKGNQKTRAPFPPMKKEKVPIKFNPTRRVVPEMTNTPGLGPCVMVIVTDGKKSRQITMHHPIGVTELKDDAWIASSADQVEELLSRIKDPSDDLKRKKRTDKALRKLIEAYPNMIGMSDEGSVVFKKTNDPKDRYGFAWNARDDDGKTFLDQRSITLMAFFKAEIKRLEEAEPKYITCSGIAGDVPQRPSGYEAPSTAALMDKILQDICTETASLSTGSSFAGPSGGDPPK